jgi:UDP-2,4-diacetamido-2,4,6-trideoxy-beta-L-altropyranose hydrolase
MQVLIRTDASVAIGSGHVMRCLTLAAALRERGAQVAFICRELPGHLCERIEASGFRVLRLLAPGAADGFEAAEPAHAAWLGVDRQTDARQCTELLARQARADWLLVDHYALDRRWETALRPCAGRIMAIDDLADRAHDCDLLLDQNYYCDQQERYGALVPDVCVRLLGPSHALLRPEFVAARAALGPRDGSVRRVLVFFGASDIANDTLKALQAIAEAAPMLAVDAVVGVNNPHRATIRAAAADMADVRCHDFADMAVLMSAADLYIGAAGTTTWERCCLGLPSLVLGIGASQLDAIADLHRAGATQVLGASESVPASALAAALREALAEPARLAAYSTVSMEMIDGRGAQRCCELLFNQYGKS